jgi:hypothetical protein
MTKVEISVATALQELKLIGKLLDKRYENLRKYSSKMRGMPDSIDNQKDFVKSEMQAASDYIKRYRDTKLAIMRSNLDTTFNFEQKTYSVAEAILYKSHLEDMYNTLYACLTSYTAENQIRQVSDSRRVSLPEETREMLNIVPELYYNEQVIQTKKEQLLRLMANLNALIDEANHRAKITI